LNPWTLYFKTTMNLSGYRWNRLLERSGNPDIGAEFDFAPADLLFVEKLQNGGIAIQS